ncbi:TPA: hypothetical protein JAN03_24310 [Citrobacter freundii]|nr:hypothetical protein [Citrobacter freundii]
MKDDQGMLMSVSLDQLQAFDLNPRITRNPEYDKIKESIRNRGLDLPPQITQRPKEKHFIIANGGNTRLAILNELWLETHNKKYFYITCRFRAWHNEKNVEEGNLHYLLGHLVENERRGSLTYIERALGVQKAAELCQQIFGGLSQAELLQKLAQGGYVIHQSAYSKILATIHHLLPHIPELLYSGLPKLTIEKLLTLRACTLRLWEAQYDEMATEKRQIIPAFDDVFASALIPFNTPQSGFSIEHVQDELTGLVSQALGLDYNTVALVTDASARKRQSLLGLPEPVLPEVSQQRKWELKLSPVSSHIAETSPIDKNSDSEDVMLSSDTDNYAEPKVKSDDTPSREASTVLLTNSDAAGVCTNTATSRHLSADIIWDINPTFDDIDSLVSLVEQTAWELAGIAGLEHLIIPSQEAGFYIEEPEKILSDETRIYWQLLSFIAGKHDGTAAIWHQFILGSGTAAGGADETVIRVFQLIRLLRRLHEKQREVTIQ